VLRAFHRQCIQCHEADKSGPVFCGDCHKGS
jgi:mono/diheme cytochrome c family protein